MSYVRLVRRWPFYSQDSHTMCWIKAGAILEVVDGWVRPLSRPEMRRKLWVLVNDTRRVTPLEVLAEVAE